jgi:hypothetical protein
MNRYCKTVLQTLKSAGMRSPEVEMCKALATSLEERIRLHMQVREGKMDSAVDLLLGFLLWHMWRPGGSSCVGFVFRTSPGSWFV